MRFELTPTNTYKTKENALRAIDKTVSKELQDRLHWYIAEDSGRFFPVFVGQQALQNGIHFYFTCVC